MIERLFNAIVARLLPSGGASGQVLKKSSASDYDVGWSADESGGGGNGNGNGGGTVRKTARQSTFTPSKAATAITTGGTVGIDLAAGTLDATQGVTVSNNEITFANAGLYHVNLSMDVAFETSPALTGAGGGRIFTTAELGHTPAGGSETILDDTQLTAYARQPDNHTGTRVGPDAYHALLAGSFSFGAGDKLAVKVRGDFIQPTDSAPPGDPVTTSLKVSATDSMMRISSMDVTGGGGEVSSDATLTGDGSDGDPLKVANPFTDADETKLDGIETGATADQTAAEIVGSLEGLSGSARLAGTAVRNIPTDSIANGAITTGKINALAVDATKLATNAVGNRAMADDAVREAEIQNGAVTAAKLASAVSTRLVPTGGSDGQVLKRTGASGFGWGTDETGSGGGTQTLTEIHHETTATPSVSSAVITVGGANPVVDVGIATLAGDHAAQGVTIANNRMVFARANHYDIDVSLELSMLSTNSPQNQGVRGYFDIEMFKSTGSSGAKSVLQSSVYTAYLRASSNSPGRTQSPASQRFAIACNIKLAAGDAVGLQIRARHLQTTTPVWRINVNGTNSEVRVVSDDYTLS